MNTILNPAIEALTWADEFLTARDEMNSKIHCAPVRLSPLTERVKLVLQMAKQTQQMADKEVEMLRRILAVTRMANREHPDIRVANALADWDKAYGPVGQANTDPLMNRGE